MHLLLARVIQISLFKLIQQVLKVLSLLNQLIGLGLKTAKFGRSLLPDRPGFASLNHLLLERCTSELIKPATLLTRTGQLLRLTLNREIDQQRTQLQQLLPIHGRAIETTAT